MLFCCVVDFVLSGLCCLAVSSCLPAVLFAVRLLATLMLWVCFVSFWIVLLLCICWYMCGCCCVLVRLFSCVCIVFSVCMRCFCCLCLCCLLLAFVQVCFAALVMDEISLLLCVVHVVWYWCPCCVCLCCFTVTAVLLFVFCVSFVSYAYVGLLLLFNVLLV